jgi:hypothetical protein
VQDFEATDLVVLPGAVAVVIISKSTLFSRQWGGMLMHMRNACVMHAKGILILKHTAWLLFS